MKKFLKAGIIATAIAAVLAIGVLFAGCSNNVTVDGIYSFQSYRRDQNTDYGTDWIWQTDYNLVLNSDSTYILQKSEAASGTTDQNSRGERLTVYIGTYATADNTDLGEGYLDITLEKATRVIYSQKLQAGLYFGGEYIADSAATEWSEELAEMSGYESAAAFLEATAKGFSITVNTLNGLMNAEPTAA